MQNCLLIILKYFLLLMMGVLLICAVCGTTAFICDTVKEHKQSKCPKCGKRHFWEVFCPDCGVRILPDVKCPKCGRICTGQYCGNCGTKLTR